MLFESVTIDGAWLISQEPYEDDRGQFSRVYCKREFEEQGIELNVVQASRAVSHQAGTLRGLHYQPHPYAEPKLMQCLRGAIYDVIIDMRPASPTYLNHFAIKLSGDNGKMLFVPPNCAHGYMTLQEESEIMYMAGEFYVQGGEVGVRYNDPVFGIQWPAAVKVISDRDKNWPLLDEGKK